MRTQMLIRTPEKLKESLQVIADKQGVSVNALILQILWEWVRKETKEREATN